LARRSGRGTHQKKGRDKKRGKDMTGTGWKDRGREGKGQTTV